MQDWTVMTGRIHRAAWALVMCMFVALGCGGCPNPGTNADEDLAETVDGIVADAETATNDFEPAGDEDGGGGDDTGSIESQDSLGWAEGLYFAVELPADPADPTVRAYAYSVDDAALPEGTYTWTFDDEVTAGPMQTHADLRHRFSTGGVHLISLTIAAFGYTAQIGCSSSSGNANHTAEVELGTRISGVVADAEGTPLPGVTIKDASGAVRATTDVRGHYQVTVSAGWSGALLPGAPGWAFDPPQRVYQSLQTDVEGAGFLGAPASTPRATAGPRGDLNCDGIVSFGDLNPFVLALTSRATYEAQFPDCEWLHGDVNDDGQVTFSDINPFYTLLVYGNPPVADPQSVTANEDVTKTIILSGSDPDGDTLTYVIVTLPSHGTLQDRTNNAVITPAMLPYTLISGGKRVKYTNEMFHIGDYSFTFCVNDGQANSPPATVSITVLYGNHPPIADPQSVSLAPDEPKAVTLTGSDPHDDPLTFAVDTPPQHGTLAGTPPSVVYTPAAGYTGEDSFTFHACDGYADSPPAEVTLGIGGWQAPLGIPTPPFGVAEHHTMYAGQQWNYGGGPEPYRDAGNGPYTHYVDNTHAASTDTNNTYGSPSKPRKTIPQNLPAGSVAEVHGGPYTYTVGGMIPLGGAGTAAQPIFIRGVAATGKVSFRKPLDVTGQYVIIEHLDLNAWSTSNDCGVSIDGAHNHVCIRHSEMRDGPEATTCAIAIGGSSSSAKAEYIVIYDNLIHDNGDWQATYDQDHHGIGVSSYAEQIWVLDNEMYHNSGDGIQINGSNATTHHIYVGRNLSWQNKQCGFWCKYASDVIFSQNTAHSHAPSDSSPGGGLGWQYGPDRIWFLFNHSYDNTVGIVGPSANSAGEPAYIVGNVIHDCSEMGINLWNNRSIYVLNNTIARTGSGISISGSTALYAVNNVIADMTASGYAHLTVEGDMSNSSRAQYNLFYQSNGAVRINWGNDTNWNVATFQANVTTATGNREANPQFSDAGADDFHVQAASPAVNNGTAGGYAQQVYNEFQARYGQSIAVDYDGVPRPVGAAYDIGAFER